MPRTPTSPAPNSTNPTPSLFPTLTRLRQLLTGRAPTTADLAAAVAELTRAHAQAADAARAARARHERAVLELLATANEAQPAGPLEQSRADAVAAAAHEAELTLALASLQERLATQRERDAAAQLQARWEHAQSLLQARRVAMARLQAHAEAYAEALAGAVDAGEAAWAALPQLPAHRPATYGRDLYARANLYLYGLTDGKSGSGALSPHVARQRPDLLTLDAGAREILLLPLSATQARAAIAQAARQDPAPAKNPKPGKDEGPRRQAA